MSVIIRTEYAAYERHDVAPPFFQDLDYHPYGDAGWNAAMMNTEQMWHMVEEHWL